MSDFKNALPKIFNQSIAHQNLAIGSPFIAQYHRVTNVVCPRVKISVGFRPFGKQFRLICLWMVEFLSPLALSDDRVASSSAGKKRNSFLNKRVV